MASEPTPPRPRRARRGRRILQGVLFGVLLLTLAVLSLIAGFYVALARNLPPLELTESASALETTKIFDDSSSPVLLAELRGPETPTILSSADIPESVKNAMVAAMDEGFYEHSGMDFGTILGAVWTSITHGDVAQSSSSITQELVRAAFLADQETADHKLHDAALAYRLETQWSKDKILTEYLNLAYFGQGAYGIEAAALTYFGVHAADLELQQAAFVASLPLSPDAYFPRRSLSTALSQRDAVLNKMYQQGYITSEALQEGLASPLEFSDGTNDDEVGLPYWVDMVREQLVARYGMSSVLAGGLRVYVSVDLELQQAAEDSIAQILDQPGDPSAALVAIDVKSGRLVAMVGGQDYSGLNVNLATESRRQPGSAFGPFVLATALQQGISPDATYASGPFTIYLPTGILAIASVDQGPLSVTEAIIQSSDGVLARLGIDVGVAEITRVAQDMGIETPLGDPPSLAIALGELPIGVSVLEMAMAYATLATGGQRLSAGVDFDRQETGYPITIVRVTDAEGTVLDANTAARTRVLDESVVAMVTDCLTNVVTSGAGIAADIGRPAAGATGTTRDDADTWFVGYTPDLVTAVWVGYPNERKPMTGVGGGSLTGCSLPAMIWASFMNKALPGLSASQFPSTPDEGWISVDVCAESHQLPTEFCPEVTTMLFRADQVPAETCAVHAPHEVPVPKLVGLTLDDAARTLRAALFGVRPVDDRASLEPAGTVTGQNPRAGTNLMQGSVVTVNVSTGEAITTVPGVVGLDITAAKAKLNAEGLLIDEYPVADDTPAGTIISQDPAPGTTVPVGWHVSLYFSTGPQAPASP